MLQHKRILGFKVNEYHFKYKIASKQSQNIYLSCFDRKSNNISESNIINEIIGIKINLLKNLHCNHQSD